MINKDTIDTIFETARIEEVIGEYVHLKKAGANYKGLSPFTNEKTPSFVVSPAKQIYKCFSSGKGGNVVGFIMEHDHLSYPEALKYLAKKYNIEIEEEKQTPEQEIAASERESLYIVSEFAQKYFTETLLESEEGKAIGLSYFKQRGFTDETIKKFKLGYNPDSWDAFTGEALKQGYKLEFLEKTGLTIVKGDKQFDRFKGRVMFPIESLSGRILGFGGRILKSDAKAAKYVNSPESEIYHKSKVLYGIYQAKQEIIKQDNCYLVEGYTDVISLHQAGIHNVVASSGTALTPEQIRLIKRLTPNITILYDGDNAGIKASFRGIDLILEEGMNVRVLLFPEGEDPDSYARSVDKEELKEYLEKSTKDFISFKATVLAEEAQNDPIKKAGLIKDMVTSIAKIPDRITRDVYIQECSRLMDISETVLSAETAQIRRKLFTEKRPKGEPDQMSVVHSPTYEEEKPKQNAFDFEEQEKAIMSLLLNYGEKEIELTRSVEEVDEVGQKFVKDEAYTTTITEAILIDLQIDGIEFENPIYNEIFLEAGSLLNQGQIVSGTYFARHENEGIMNKTIDLITEKYELSDWSLKEIHVKDLTNNLDKSLKESILRLKEKRLSKQIQELAEAIKTNLDDEQLLKTKKKLVKMTTVRQRINNELNRVC